MDTFLHAEPKSELTKALNTAVFLILYFSIRSRCITVAYSSDINLCFRVGSSLLTISGYPPKSKNSDKASTTLLTIFTFIYSAVIMPLARKYSLNEKGSTIVFTALPRNTEGKLSKDKSEVEPVINILYFRRSKSVLSHLDHSGNVCAS